MSGPVYRLYLAEYERCQAWMGGGASAFLKYVEPYDMYSVYITGRSKLPPDHYRDTLKKLGERCEIIDATQMPDRDLHAHMLGQINKYATNDTYVFFIGSDEDFNALKGKASQWKSFSQVPTYRTGRIELPPGVREGKKKAEEKIAKDKSQDEKTMAEALADKTSKSRQKDASQDENPAINDQKDQAKKKPKTGNNKHPGSGRGGNVQAAEMMNLFLGNISGVNIGDQHSPGNKTQPSQKGATLKTPKEDGSPAVPKSDRENVNPQKQKGQEKTDPKEKKKGRGQKRPEQGQASWRQRISSDPKSKEKGTDASWTQQQLEKAIFGTEQDYSKTEKIYTELDDSKAKTVSLLADRLIGNINKLVRGIRDYGFGYEDYMELVATLVKSDSLSDFHEGWGTVHPGCELGLDEETYNMLYKEAKYYAKACDVLDGEDRW